MKPAQRDYSTILTTRPVAISVAFLAMVVFGLLSMGRLPVQLMPELTYPTLTVRTEYPGAAPEEVENDIGRPVEEALSVVGGLRKISSINRAGISDVVLEFAWDTEIHDATQDVLEKLDRVFLPDEAERPLILHYDPQLEPIVELSLSGKGERFAGEQGLRRLRRLAELQLKRDLEPIKGVAAVRVRGGLEEEIHVLLDAAALHRTGISVQQVISRLAQENINVAGGTLKEGRTEYLVRTLNEYENIEQIGETIVATFDDRPVRVRDLGRVEVSQKEREILTRVGGAESVQIDIYKEADANIVEVAKRVKAAVGELRGEDATAASAPSARADADGGDSGPGALAQTLYANEGATLAIVADRSLFIESSIDEVKSSAISGALLAILVLYLFLHNVKSTVIIAITIPISLFITFAPLNLMGVSMNIMSLGGLALSIGMLIDTSIVVLESIFRCREEGDDIVRAAERGTSEVHAAVVASQLTSVAVFFPMVFVEGIAGQAFGDLGLAVVFSQVPSLAVSLYLVPMLASRQGLQWSSGGATQLKLLRPIFWRQTIEAFRGWKRPQLRRLPKRLAPLYVVTVPLQWLGFVLAPLYWVVRLLVGSVVELVGKLLLATIMFVIWSFRRGVLPLLTVFPGFLFRRAAGGADGLMRRTSALYERVLRTVLLHPVVVVVFVAGCFALTWTVASTMDSELLPEVHQGEFTVEVTLPVGTPLDETDAAIAPIERAILSESEHIRALILTVGYDPSNTQRSDEGEHSARFKVLLAEGHRGAAVEQAVIDRLRARFEAVPDLEAHIVRPVLFSSKTPIEVEVQGQDLQALMVQSGQVAQAMAAIPELTDVESTLRSGAPEVQIVYDRDRLSLYGLNIAEVARHVRDKVKGFEATRFNLKDRRIPILVRLALSDRETVADVENIVVNPGGARPIPLSAVAAVTLGEGPSEVRRIGGSRVAVVRANLAGDSLSGAANAIDAALAEIDWPIGMGYTISGQNEEWQKSQRTLWLAMALSVFLVYVIMAAQFESLVHPLVIMLTIPLAFVGTFVCLKVMGLNLSVVVLLGMIMLAGIVVNNAIVLIDYVNTLRGRDMPRNEAILTAGRVRLRPILMTTGTTVLGLVPLALGLGDGAEIRAPMAIAVISGLVSSTVLTLVVVPSVYAMLDDAAAWLFGRRVRMADEAAPAGVGGGPTADQVVS